MKQYIYLIVAAALLALYLIISIDVSKKILPQAKNSPLQAIKDKWMDCANQNVEREKQAFLKMYNLNDAQLLKDETLIYNLKTSNDQMIESTLNAFSDEESAATEKVYALASKIFLGDYCKKLKIIHQVEWDADELNVAFHYGEKKAFITLNCDIAVQHNQSPLEEILRHGYSYIVHEDNFHKELLLCHAWAASQDSIEKIDENNYGFQKAFATRADIFSAVASADHGQSLITFLEKYAGQDTPSHPSDADRIALLKTVKAELDNASL